MSSFAGQHLFDSGPHDLTPGPWQRCTQRRGFAGLDGEILLDLGLRSRQLAQAGRLQASTAQALHGLIDSIQDLCDGSEHALIDNHEQVYSRVYLERFQVNTPLRRGRGFYCDYRIDYRQLP